MYNYYRDEPNSGAENGINYSIKDSKSFDYKTSIKENLEGNNTELKNIKIAVPLKYLSRFFRVLDIPLINCEVSLDLKWNKNCVLISKAKRPAGDHPAVNPAINNPADAKFGIIDCTLYVPVVTLSTEYENKLYQQLKEGFTINVHWYKYRCQITNQRIGSINYLIDSVLDDVRTLYVLAYENEEDRSSFSKYYTPTVKITDYNVLIDHQPFFELPVKNKKETFEKIIELSKVLNDYTTSNLLNYVYFLNHYKLIAIDLCQQSVNLTRQQINFKSKCNNIFYHCIRRKKLNELLNKTLWIFLNKHL